MTTTSLATALRACSAGLYPLEAGVGLLIANGTFLHRQLHQPLCRPRHHRHGSSRRGRRYRRADSRRTAVLRSEHRTFRLAASLAGGTPVDLSDAVTGIDQHNIQRLVTAIRHASGQRQPANPEPHKA
jgi:hypothetical protein